MRVSAKREMASIVGLMGVKAMRARATGITFVCVCDVVVIICVAALNFIVCYGLTGIPVMFINISLFSVVRVFQLCCMLSSYCGRAPEAPFVASSCVCRFVFCGSRSL